MDFFKKIFGICFIIFCFCSCAEENKQPHEIVEIFIDGVKTSNIDKIKKSINSNTRHANMILQISQNFIEDIKLIEHLEDSYTLKIKFPNSKAKYIQIQVATKPKTHINDKSIDEFLSQINKTIHLKYTSDIQKLSILKNDLHAYLLKKHKLSNKLSEMTKLPIKDEFTIGFKKPCVSIKVFEQKLQITYLNDDDLYCKNLKKDIATKELLAKF